MIKIVQVRRQYVEFTYTKVRALHDEDFATYTALKIFKNGYHKIAILCTR